MQTAPSLDNTKTVWRLIWGLRLFLTAMTAFGILLISKGLAWHGTTGWRVNFVLGGYVLVFILACLAWCMHPGNGDQSEEQQDRVARG